MCLLATIVITLIPWSVLGKWVLWRWWFLGSERNILLWTRNLSSAIAFLWSYARLCVLTVINNSVSSLINPCDNSFSTCSLPDLTQATKCCDQWRACCLAFHGKSDQCTQWQEWAKRRFFFVLNKTFWSILRQNGLVLSFGVYNSVARMYNILWRTVKVFLTPSTPSILQSGL